jgi:phosphate transport system permease protein
MSTIVPAARIGLVTGFLIAFARAAGEAAPLMFTSFGNNYLPTHWTGMILGPVDTLPQRLYSLAISPYAEWHTMGWAAGIVTACVCSRPFRRGPVTDKTKSI